MHPELADAIRLFRRDQELALDYLHGKLGIPVPKTASEWSTRYVYFTTVVYPLAAKDGVTLCHHGYGIEVIHPDFRINFDYGMQGECDGFDRWRLSVHRHLRLRLPNPVKDPRPLKEWLADAVASGELIQTELDSLYYHPALRSRWPSVSPSG